MTKNNKAEDVTNSIHAVAELSNEEQARKRAKEVFEELTEESNCDLSSPLYWKKVTILLLVLLEICIFIYWMINPTSANFEKLIAPTLFVSVIFTLIILLGNTIAKEERELAKAKAEMIKEAFMRRLK